jgi:hypothetical protein
MRFDRREILPSARNCLLRRLECRGLPWNRDLRGSIIASHPSHLIKELRTASHIIDTCRIAGCERVL